jgi:hypothetical protein
VVATRGGLWLAGADASDDVSVTQGPWTGAVDLVHRSTVDRSKGYESLLIWATDFHRTAAVACRRRAAAGRRLAAARDGGQRKRKNPTGGPHLSARGRERRGEAAERAAWAGSSCGPR